MPSQRLVVGFVFLVACEVGSVLPPEGEVDGPAAAAPDGGGGGGGGDGGGNVACEPAATNLPNGEHNPGQACLTCHGPGGEGPRFTMGGTLYSTLQGGAVVPGATIVVVDAASVTTRLVTASNGNFYSTQTFALPVQVSASKCPDSRPMVSAVQDGDCNGCHQAGTSGRIYLP